MKRIMCLNKLIIALFMFTVVSCEGIFIPDPIDPRLPKYTEKGNNVAGAFINEDVWKSVVVEGFFVSESEPYLWSFPSGDSIVIHFEGNLPGDYATINFHLSGYKIDDFSSLNKLKGYKIALDGEDSYGVFLRNGNSIESLPCYGKGGTGQIYIKNVSFDDADNAILSGTFGFTINDASCGTVEITFGRFDYVFNKYSEFIVFNY